MPLYKYILMRNAPAWHCTRSSDRLTLYPDCNPINERANPMPIEMDIPTARMIVAAISEELAKEALG
jgi:hypothetical protein